MNNKIIIGVIVLVVIIIIALVMRGDQEEVPSVQEEQEIEEMTEGMPVPGSETEEMIAEEEMREIEVVGRPFSFTPSVITLEVGERVRVNFVNAQGLHDFVIEGTDIRTSIIEGGSSESIEFSLDEPGEYVFFCSVPGHREAGMVGTIIVE